MVLDASAVLALLFEEPGAEVVRAHLRTGVIDQGLPAAEAVRAVAILGLEVAPMTETQARRSAELRPLTRGAGLSLGDRACLALAAGLGALAVTADRGWDAVAGASGVSVQVIR